MERVFNDSADDSINDVKAVIITSVTRKMSTLLSHTKQAKLFEGMAGRDNVEKRVLYRACEKRLAMSQNPVVCAICYDELLRIECMDISTVAESISYGLAPETAQNLLIKE